jgi:hypothetical protein
MCAAWVDTRWVRVPKGCVREGFRGHVAAKRRSENQVAHILDFWG